MEGLTEGFFALPVWGAYIWRDLYMEGPIFGIFTVSRYYVVLRKDSRLSITRTLANSNLALPRTKTDFPWISLIHLHVL